MTHENYPSTTPSECMPPPINFFCLSIRLTDFLKGTKSSSKRIHVSLTLTNFSWLTSVSEMKTFLSAPPSDWQAKALYPHAPSSSSSYVVFSTQTLQVNPYRQAAQHHLQKMESLHLSSKPLADGLLMPSRFTFGRTFSLDSQCGPNLPSSMLWNPNFLFTLTDFHLLLTDYCHLSGTDLLPFNTSLHVFPSLSFPIAPHIIHYVNSSSLIPYFPYLFLLSFLI